MLPVTMLRALGCQIFGHAPTVRGVAGMSKADYVCGRCGTVLGAFVADPHRRRTRPTDCTAARPASNRERELSESTWLDDGGRDVHGWVGVPAAVDPATDATDRRGVSPRGILNARIGKQVIRALGAPADVLRVQVRRLWPGRYRVNDFVGPDPGSARVANTTTNRLAHQRSGRGIARRLLLRSGHVRPAPAIPQPDRPTTPRILRRRPPA